MVGGVILNKFIFVRKQNRLYRYWIFRMYSHSSCRAVASLNYQSVNLHVRIALMLDAPASLTVSFIDFPFLKGLIVSFLLVGFIFNLIIVLTCKKMSFLYSGCVSHSHFSWQDIRKYCCQWGVWSCCTWWWVSFTRHVRVTRSSPPMIVYKVINESKIKTFSM